MIDTIGINYTVAVDHYHEFPWVSHQNGNRYWYTLEVRLTNSAPIKYAYYPYALGGTPLLKIEFSLPHVLYGNNSIMIYDIQRAVNAASALLPVIPGIPHLDLWAGRLYRLDVCYNHQVGNLVPYYNNAIGHLRYPRRESPTVYGNNGVQFKNKRASFKVYDKMEETGNLDDWGILRQEATLRQRSFEKRLGTKHPTLKDLSPDLLFEVLEHDLLAVGVYGRSIGTRDTTLERLQDEFGGREAIYLFGLLMSMQEYPNLNTVAKASHYHPRSLEKQLKRIADKGIPLAITTSKEDLPPLIIDRDMVRREEEDRMRREKRGDTNQSEDERKS